MAPNRVCFGVVAALLGDLSVSAARVKRTGESASAKMIAGIPIVNYHKSLQAKASSRAASIEEDWIVMMKAGATSEEIHAICGRAGAACKMVGNPTEGGVPFLEIRGTEAGVETILQGTDSAIFLEPDTPERILDLDVPIDEVSASAAAGSWNVLRVGRETAATTGQGVHVYVVDSGVRTTHEDFGGRAIPTLDMTVGNGKECGGDPTCATDSIGHGTHCAGTVGGNTYGLATGAKVHAMKISFDGIGIWSKTVGAFDWIAAKGEKPAVVSASVGGEGDAPSLTAAVDALIKAGVTVITSAGNSQNDACGYTPANIASVMSVGATSVLDTKAYFSNFGKCVDIWAPGMQIDSCSHSSDTGKAKKQGTSMACPLVAAGAALLLEANPSLSPAQTRTALVDKALDGWVEDLGSDDTNKLLWIGTGTPPPPGSLEPCRRRRRVLCYD
jgi:subtilisin family serine protease